MDILGFFLMLVEQEEVLSPYPLNVISLAAHNTRTHDIRFQWTEDFTPIKSLFLTGFTLTNSLNILMSFHMTQETLHVLLHVLTFHVLLPTI